FVRAGRGDERRHLVAAPGAMARGALRRGQARATTARIAPASVARRRAGQLRHGSRLRRIRRMTPPAMKRVAIGPQTVRYLEGGSPDAPRTLLLFNGIGASVETVAPFMASFKRTRVIAFDVPGVGESPEPARLPVPAAGGMGLDELAPAAPRAGADAGADGVRRPDRAADQWPHRHLAPARRDAGKRRLRSPVRAHAARRNRAPRRAIH